ncbi:unnamed protein product [Rotaria sp. Silwood2]|nr:unnamed protein product [Rotaria sp. Silwood2]CAF2958595.1 unnamed protein product [Rotaria sp. Silwood2]CAF3333534.1 unnamed protein product [Rotaria sp. Silwood2]CAF3965765.1 unnamed protein product [Rotaria sp. Silwood2]CAF4096625.1 unnamed protein product [Rotaria sp. Silwood2]
MASNSIHCEVVACNLNRPTSIQIDEERNILYVLTNYRLTRIDLNNNNNNNVEIVRQHNRKFQKDNIDDDDDDDEYSQGESDDERDTPRVSNPFDDSEPSTDDDEERITDRRNWRRYGWRNYRLDNPTSILFLSENNQLIILNEGVITFLTIELNDDHPFVREASKNIFCYDYNVFNNGSKRQSIQPWSISSTSIPNFFVFSLLESSQLYSLDMQNETISIEKFATTSIEYCPCLIFHSQLNKIFVYDSNQIFAMSLDDKSTIKVNLPFTEQGKTISTMTIDKTGYIYVLSNSTIFKCIWQLEFQLIECLGKLVVLINYPQMIVTNQKYQFYLSDMEAASIYRSTV